MLNWSIEEKTLPLKFTWKISRNSSDEKKNLFIFINDDNYQAMGEIAPNIRYGETVELIKQQFLTFLQIAPQEIIGIEEFGQLIDSLNLHHSLRFGLESAFIHLISKQKNLYPAQIFNLQMPESVTTSFSIPIINIGEIKNFVEPLKRFVAIKLKVNQENALDIVKETAKYTDQKLRVDGNESWTDVNELLKFIDQVKGYNIEFIEQPMPSNLVNEYQYLKPLCPYDLIADESVEDKADFELIKTQFHGVNMKLMKAGGYINGLKILEQARTHNLKTMMGCMIETSLGIYSAFNLAHNVDYLDLDGFLIIKDDPFNLVKEDSGLIYLST